MRIVNEEKQKKTLQFIFKNDFHPCLLNFRHILCLMIGGLFCLILNLNVFYPLNVLLLIQSLTLTQLVYGLGASI